jgi:DNA-binding NarL/FixJ family response regulator
VTLATRSYGNKEIARALGISESTVKNHLTVAYRALGVRNRTGALVVLYREALRDAG